MESITIPARCNTAKTRADDLTIRGDWHLCIKDANHPGAHECTCGYSWMPR